MSVEVDKYPSYRWVILAMGWCVFVLAVWINLLLSPLANSVITDLDITLPQFVLLFTAPIAIAIPVPLLAGILADHFGFKKCLGIAIGVLGGFLALASIAPNYWLLLVFRIFIGIGFGFMLPNMGKLVKTWFSPKELGFVSGLYMTGFGAGSTLALAVTVPLFATDWRAAMLTLAIAAVVLSFLWFIIVREKPSNIELPKREKISTKAGLSLAIRSRNIWLIALMSAFYLGGFLTLTSLLPKALADVQGVDPVTAGLLASLITFGRLLGDLFIPKLSDKMGLRRPFFIISALGTAACVYLGWYFAMSPATWILFGLGGILISGIGTLLLVIPLELPEVGIYGVTANSMCISIANLGAFLIPTYVVAPLAETASFTVAFLVAMAFLGSTALFTLFLKETGWRGHHPES